MITQTAILWAAAIFGLRILDVSLGTIRMVTIVRGWRAVSALIGFVEVTIFIVVISRVLSHIDSWINVVAYAGGFAAGTFVGMTIERHIAPGKILMRVISRGIWSQVADKLRGEGFGVTEFCGIGKDGTVMMLESVIRRKNMPKFVHLVEEVDPCAFVTSEETRFISRGYITRRDKKK
ncbi:MAG: DUF2179 domain-containing protein [Pseudomonadota bacterium]